MFAVADRPYVIHRPNLGRYKTTTHAVASPSGRDTTEDNEEEAKGDKDPFNPSEAFFCVLLAAVGNTAMSAVQTASEGRCDRCSTCSPEYPRKEEEDTMARNTGKDGPSCRVEPQNGVQKREEYSPDRAEEKELSTIPDISRKVVMV